MDSGHGNLAGIREEFASLAITRKFVYIKDLWWLCWEAAANVSLPSKFHDFRENTGNFRRFSPPDGEALQLSNILSQLVTAKFPVATERRELASSYQGRQEGERSLLPERTPTSPPPL
jgi:hypothetical protein